MPPELFAFQGKKQRSAYKKVLIITLAVLEGFFTTLPYGWASLVVVLKADGFYSDLCHADSSDCQQITWNTSAHETDSMTTLAVRFNETAPVAIATTYDTVGVYGEYCTCSAQDERLNLVFTIAMSLTLSMCFPTGAVYDLLGPRKTRLICCFIFEIAIIILIFSSRENPDLIFPATAMLGVIGAPILVSLFEVANMFPNWRYTLVSVLNGACMMSTTVFLIVQKLHEIGISMQSQFVVLLFLTSCLFVLNTYYVVPMEKVPWPPPNTEKPKYYPELFDEECVRLKEYDYKGTEMNHNSSNLKSEEGFFTSDLNIFHQMPVKTYSPLSNNMETDFKNDKIASFLQTIKTPMFLWFLVWSSLMTFREYYFIGTLNPFLGYITDGNKEIVDEYTALFGYISLGVVFVAPLVGMVMDSKSDTPLFASITALMITTSHTVLYSLTILIPIIQVQILTFVLVTIQRGFIHGVLSSFIGMAFPQNHYGKFYGVTYFVAGIVTLLQSPLFKASQNMQHSNPFYINLAILVCTMLAHVHPIYVWSYCDREIKERIEENKKPLQATRKDMYT